MRSSVRSAGNRFGTTRRVQPGRLGWLPCARRTSSSGGVIGSLPGQKGQPSSSSGSGSLRSSACGRSARSGATITQRPTTGSLRSSGMAAHHTRPEPAGGATRQALPRNALRQRGSALPARELAPESLHLPLESGDALRLHLHGRDHPAGVSVEIDALAGRVDRGAVLVVVDEEAEPPGCRNRLAVVAPGGQRQRLQLLRIRPQLVASQVGDLALVAGAGDGTARPTRRIAVRADQQPVAEILRIARLPAAVAGAPLRLGGAGRRTPVAGAITSASRVAAGEVPAQAGVASAGAGPTSACQ